MPDDGPFDELNGRIHDLEAAVVSALWWLIPLLLLVIAAVVLVLLAVSSYRYRHGPGLASSGQVLGVSSRTALTSSARYTRPGWTRRRGCEFREVGSRIGRTGLLGRTWFGASHEDAIGVLAPQRQGKTRRLLVRFIADAPGTVVAASTKLDLLDLSRPFVSSRRVILFDPDVVVTPELAADADVVRWSPVMGCEKSAVAIRRAAAFVGDGASSDATNAKFFAGSAAQVLQCLLHAAALGGHTMADVVRWAADSRDPQALTILGAHSGAAPGWAGMLAGHVSGSKSEADVFKQLNLSLNLFADPDVLRRASPDPTEQFDVDAFLTSGDALFVLSSNRAVNSSAYTTMFVTELLTRGQDLALEFDHQRWEAPVTFVLDELTNTARVPTFPAVLADSGGRGLAIRWAAQGRSYLVDVWGRQGAQSIMNNSTWKVVLGGMDDADFLSDLERLAGPVDRPVRGSLERGPRSTPAMPIASIRTQRPMTATVWATSLPPFRTRLVDIGRDNEAKPARTSARNRNDRQLEAQVPVGPAAMSS